MRDGVKVQQVCPLCERDDEVTTAHIPVSVNGRHTRDTHNTYLCEHCAKIFIVHPEFTLPTVGEFHWENRFRALASDIQDLARKREIEAHTPAVRRCWDPPTQLYYSFCGSACDSEQHAIEHFGKGNYDIYRLEKYSPKDMEGEEKPEVGEPMELK